jgi:uracil-DNA glycosylase
MLPPIPQGWRTQLEEELHKPYFQDLQKFLEEDRRKFEVYPREEDTFRALELTPYNDVNVLLLGQDPYPGPGMAHGLCFSVAPDVRPIPGSLSNMFKELTTDAPGFHRPNNGCLIPWAKQGMLMLNTLLTVRAHAPNSHKRKGWEQFTEAIIAKVAEKKDPVVFLLLGKEAQKKMNGLKVDSGLIVNAPHPAGQAAHLFFGSKPFSRVNAALTAAGKSTIDWKIPNN